VAFVLLIIPAQMLSTTGSALLLSTLIFVASSTGALNGALMHTMVRPEAIARGTGVYAGIGMLSSAIGPWLFGMLISTLAGEYWGGFAFLAVLNTVGAIATSHCTAYPPKCAGLRKPALSNRLRFPSPRLDEQVRHDERLRLAQMRVALIPRRVPGLLLQASLLNRAVAQKVLVIVWHLSPA
jgi:hypothetical protein